MVDGLHFRTPPLEVAGVEHRVVLLQQLGQGLGRLAAGPQGLIGKDRPPERGHERDEVLVAHGLADNHIGIH